jgi:thioredoxin reductase (NADPH)
VPAIRLGKRLPSQASKVWLLARRRGLASSMSSYLVDRIAGLSNVEVLTRTTITGLEGHDGMLEAIRWRTDTGDEVRHPIQHLFLFIGAEPNTDWLSGSGVAASRRCRRLRENFAHALCRRTQQSPYLG